MPEEFLNKTIRELTQLYGGFTATCFEVESYLQYQIPGASNECFLAQHGNFLCGCSNGVYSYLGADTYKKQAGLAWAPRVAAILSLIVSCRTFCLPFCCFKTTRADTKATAGITLYYSRCAEVKEETIVSVQVRHLGWKTSIRALKVDLQSATQPISLGDVLL